MDLADIIAALRGRARDFVSLDTPEGQDLGHLATDIGAGFTPGLGTALSARDLERARREDDGIGMMLSALGLIPFVGGVTKGVNAARKAGKGFEYPAAERMETARKNAVEMLGLPETNTAADRARALQYADDTEGVMYRGQHKAPTLEQSPLGDGSVAQAHQLNQVYPDDIYSPQAARYYGHGADPDMDAALIRRLQAVRDQPDAPLWTYRAVPKGSQQYLQHGDWVTPSKEYAVEHGESALGGNYDIIRRRVPAKALVTDANSPYEFGYDRAQTFADGPASIPIMRSANPMNAERSRFAAFDPARINENDLLGAATPEMLAAIAGGSLGTAAVVAALRGKKDEKKPTVAAE
jgi:hypothetical protein